MNNIEKVTSKKGLSATSALLVVVSLIINPHLIGFCESSSRYCYFDSVANSVGTPLFWIFSALLVASVFFLFLPVECFKTWKKYISWWIPLSLLLTFMAPEYGGSGIVSVDREGIAILFSSIFIIVSAIIILTKLYTTRTKKI